MGFYCISRTADQVGFSKPTYLKKKCLHLVNFWTHNRIKFIPFFTRRNFPWSGPSLLHHLYTFSILFCFFRHSTMIVGKTGPGKSVVWRTLQATLSTMKRNGEPGFNTVKVRLMSNNFFFKTIFRLIYDSRILEFFLIIRIRILAYILIWIFFCSRI